MTADRRKRAEIANPDFDWHAYDAALRREAERAKYALGHDSAPRRLGANQDTSKRIEYTEEQIMADKALVTQAKALQYPWKSKEEVEAAVITAYAHGNNKLDAVAISAVALIAWELQLDPSPGLGHIYAWKDYRSMLQIVIGYQGYLYKAQQQHQFFYEPARAMTTQERDEHGLAVGDIGAVVKLYDMARGKMAIELGMKPVPIIGTAVWRKSHKAMKKNGQAYTVPDDNIPSNRTALWVAGKNALKDALRQLGLGVGSMAPVQPDGFIYDHKQDAYIADGADDTITSDEIIEGEIITEPDVANAIQDAMDTDTAFFERVLAELPHYKHRKHAENTLRKTKGYDGTASIALSYPGGEAGAWEYLKKHQAEKQAEPITTAQAVIERPWSPDVLLGKLSAQAAKGRNGTKWQQISDLMATVTGNQSPRFLQIVFGKDGLHACSPGEVYALKRWLDDPQNAEIEAKALLDANPKPDNEEHQIKQQCQYIWPRTWETEYQNRIEQRFVGAGTDKRATCWDDLNPIQQVSLAQEIEQKYHEVRTARGPRTHHDQQRPYNPDALESYLKSIATTGSGKGYTELSTEEVENKVDFLSDYRANEFSRLVFGKSISDLDKSHLTALVAWMESSHAESEVMDYLASKEATNA